ncbi:MAG: hypothetical protein ACR5K9_02900 [Wolbachia sp.]
MIFLAAVRCMFPETRHDHAIPTASGLQLYEHCDLITGTTGGHLGGSGGYLETPL